MQYPTPASTGPVRYLGLLLATLWLMVGCNKDAAPHRQWENASQGLHTAILSQDGQYAVIGSINHGASLWEMPSGKRLFSWNHRQGEHTSIIAAAIADNNRYAATADHQTIVLWEQQGGKAVNFWRAPGKVLSIALTANADYALLGLADYTAVLFDIKNGGIKATFPHQGQVHNVAINRDAGLVLTGSDDFTAKLWNADNGALLHTWQHDNKLLTATLSASGKYAFTASQADRAVIWDSRSGQPLHTMPVKTGPYIAGASYTAARFSPDEQRLLTGTNNRLVQLWDISSGNELKRWRVSNKETRTPTSQTLLAVSFSAQQGVYYAIASNGLSFELR